MPETFPSCFGVGMATSNLPTTSTNSNLTTCLYQTAIGVATITWCRNIIGHGLHIDLFQFQYNNHNDIEENIHNNRNNNIASLHLHLKPWLFWKKQGSKTFNLKDANQTQINFSWDLTKARFLSSPEPESSFYVSITVDGEMVLIIGDLINEAYLKTGARKPSKNPALIMRREHMFGNKSYTTKARFNGEIHEISIESVGDRDETKLLFSINHKRVLQVKRLKWKFRGNERIDIDGMPVQVSWDVYNWIFDDAVDGHAVFMFRFEKRGIEDGGDVLIGGDCNQKGMVLWQPFGVGMKGLDEKKNKKNKNKNRSLLKTGSSSSSSSASSGSSSSVMEWASMEENEMERSGGFSLMVYAWKST
ncbi:uncharacterized protein LOC131257006 [Magnolia sinica]|uniref:uncharacterized protein LOC131257006 n=1 Tax=Magnolia sinica TaxID=86752 RepID=UPI002659854E|nr:uncharacterized protein LOC131257006 [Magnolia sinica]